MALWIHPAPQQKEHKAPSHRSNLWPLREHGVIRAWATNSQKNSRSSNKDGWKTLTKFIKQLSEIYFCLERRARYMTCLVFWYISGTFGHTAFVSFGDTTLNSWRPGHVMCWSAEVPKAKLNIQLAVLGFSTTYLCKWCHRVSIKLLILKVERLCSTAAVDIFWHSQTNGVL